MLLWKEYVGSYFPQEMWKYRRTTGIHRISQPQVYFMKYSTRYIQVSIGSSQPQVYFMKYSTRYYYIQISIGSSQPQVYFMKDSTRYIQVSIGFHNLRCIL